MPRLFKFAEENKALSDKFVILTFHSGRGEKTLAECADKFDNLLKNQWKIEKFPFPILMEDGEKTLQAWGIRAFPTCALIDPKGQLVSQNIGGGCEEELLVELKKSAGEKKP